MSGTTIISPNTTDTTLIQDGQAAGSISAGDIRQMNDSLSGVAITTQTVSYTFVAGDRGTIVRYNSASAGTFTIPPNSTVAFPVGVILGFRMSGVGLLTIAAGAGVTLNTPSTMTTLVQYATGYVHQESANVWVMS
jgi:hypothetical protein